MFEASIYRLRNGTKIGPALSESKSDARRYSLPISYTQTNITLRLEPHRRAQVQVRLSPGSQHDDANV